MILGVALCTGAGGLADVSCAAARGAGKGSPQARQEAFSEAYLKRPILGSLKCLVPPHSAAPLNVACVQLNEAQAVADYKRAKRRLLVLGYNATLTTAVEAPKQPHHHFDQIQARPGADTPHTRPAQAPMRALGFRVKTLNPQPGSAYASSTLLVAPDPHVPSLPGAQPCCLGGEASARAHGCAACGSTAPARCAGCCMHAAPRSCPLKCVVCAEAHLHS